MPMFLKRQILPILVTLACVAIADVYYGRRCDGYGVLHSDWGCISTGYQQWDCLDSQDWEDTEGCLIDDPNWRCETWYQQVDNVVTNAECVITQTACAVILEERGTIYLWCCSNQEAE